MAMMKQVTLAFFCWLAFSTACFAADQAAQPATAAQASPVQPVKTDDGQAAAKKPDRFLLVLEDTEYKYYLDTQSAHWIYRPHSDKERIIDVWVKLVETSDSEYSYPDTYLLEHYYIRPDKRQIQFLCELEVAGRPNNTVQQRQYDDAHWEDLVPGSVEEKVYQAVMDHKKAIADTKNKKDIRSVIGDFFDDTLRIAL